LFGEKRDAPQQDTKEQAVVLEVDVVDQYQTRVEGKEGEEELAMCWFG
jgi:hypothetical protein